jgi:hypothetical protein
MVESEYLSSDESSPNPTLMRSFTAMSARAPAVSRVRLARLYLLSSGFSGGVIPGMGWNVP